MAVNMEIVVILLAALLIYLLQSRLYKKYWKRGLSLSLRFERDTAFEGDSLSLIEVLTNNKLLPLPFVTVKFQVSRKLEFLDSNNSQITDYYYRNDLFSITMRQRITRKLPFICAKRGYYTIHSADLVSNNLLGTEKYAKRENPSTYLTVYPNFTDLSDFSLPFGRIGGSVIARSILNPDPFEFRGIREYLPTDSLRHINFKASARIGMLMSNEYSQTLSQELVLVLNTEKYKEWLHDDLYEYAIRLAASVTDMAIRKDIPIRLYSNGRDVVTGEEEYCETGLGERQLYNILELLARIDLEKEPVQKGSELLQSSMEHHHDNAIFILISPYYKDDLQLTFARCEEEAFDALWLLPYYKNEPEAKELLSDSVLPYEVEP